MAYHQDLNALQKLDVATIAVFEEIDEIKIMNQRIAYLTSIYEDVMAERINLYSRKAKRLLAWKDSAYDIYISIHKFTKRDRTSLFGIFEKYLPERAWLKESLFTEIILDSLVGQQCLEDMVVLCVSTEHVVFYPRLSPTEGLYLIYSKPISEIVIQGRVKHIL
ncbi:uncharacterized protein N7483_008030 [Penicillium malachiteum]|uniref:uncharacterized protein n=1 Tax=Penicillium malachiteum TaxID=1324776 RepID=UPI002548D32A|nr:uncharacterized protein N7483_008030 [Penicillium malachiteum]KAJ5726673.1 hypothetical protein N7483_008030 [Penicillium malachiteum]